MASNMLMIVVYVVKCSYMLSRGCFFIVFVKSGCICIENKKGLCLLRGRKSVSSLSCTKIGSLAICLYIPAICLYIPALFYDVGCAYSTLLASWTSLVAATKFVFAAQRNGAAQLNG